jgi:hypothetical protein
MKLLITDRRSCTDNQMMPLCPETIYWALLLWENRGLHRAAFDQAAYWSAHPQNSLADSHRAGSRLENFAMVKVRSTSNLAPPSSLPVLMAVSFQQFPASTRGDRGSESPATAR